jgi:hypothetical protein
VSYEDAPAAIAAVWEVAKDWPGWGAWDGETPESVGPALISEIRSALYYLLHHRAHRYNNNNNEVLRLFSFWPFRQSHCKGRRLWCPPPAPAASLTYHRLGPLAMLTGKSR